MKRHSRRKQNQIRDVKITCNPFGYAAGSVLFELGETKVLCAVNLQRGVPPFLKGKRTGWLTAEYSMLPCATIVRSAREISLLRRNGRCLEISRLIGRSLRTIVDLHILGERTIIVDCDVLQADGGTRTACVTGAYLALRFAVNHWLKTKSIAEDILTDSIAAISVGIVQGEPLLDLDFSEDSKAEADFNIVVTKSKKLVEIQGGSEGYPIAWEKFEQAKSMAIKGIDHLFDIVDNSLNFVSCSDQQNQQKKSTTGSCFSLQNRQNVLMD